MGSMIVVTISILITIKTHSVEVNSFSGFFSLRLHLEQPQSQAMYQNSSNTDLKLQIAHQTAQRPSHYNRAKQQKRPMPHFDYEHP